MAAFTTIAAGVGLAATAGTTAMSFTQASKQKKIQRQAEADAKQFMADARKKLEVNFYEQLGIQKEPYELEREALLAAGAQAIQAGVESERGAAATAGRIQMAQQEGQRKIASAMGQEMLGLEKLTAAEESRLRDAGVNLDLSEAEGAQLEARDAQKLAAQATKQGMQGVTNLVGQVAGMAPLFEKTASVRQLGKLTADVEKAGLSQKDFQQQLSMLGAQNPTFGNLAGVGAMNPTQFQAFMGGLSPEYLKSLRSAYNPTNIFLQQPGAAVTAADLSMGLPQ
jgi:hypothetical protein